MISIFTPLVLTAIVGLHDGPDPVARWAFDSVTGEGVVRARLGPDAHVRGRAALAPSEHGGGLVLDEGHRLELAGEAMLPERLLTASAWAAVNRPTRWGGIVGAMEDSGGLEKGWVLGYDQRRFTFGLASEGADDGDGLMTYIVGRTEYELGRLYHVVGTYDGRTMRLYVNGELEAESDAQSGDILYPEGAQLVLGAYRDSNEDHPHVGRLGEVLVYDVAAKPAWVEQEFEHDAELAQAAPLMPDEPIAETLAWRVAPFLQYATGDGVTLVFETTRPVTGRIYAGETATTMTPTAFDEPGMLHEVRIDGLRPGEPYFYRVEADDGSGQSIATEVLTFQTAAPAGTPIAFGVISDTQDNPEVAGRLAGYMWAQRPNFVILPGDLTGTGSRKGDWTEEFFPSMGGLMSRVCLYPVLGNHEEDAGHYYRYFALPTPEYYYTFTQGDAQFFMIDSNRNVDPGSEQHAWLDRELGRSTARWKFVVHHHPPYSSDENDYGDMWTGRSTHGDLRMRHLAELYDKHQVDVAFNGHIHSYERTWPIEGGRVTTDGGTVYMITGGGGGGLETPGPTRTPHANTVRRGHHYCMVRVAGDVLEMQAYDLDDRLFDQLRIEKREGGAGLTRR